MNQNSLQHASFVRRTAIYKDKSVLLLLDHETNSSRWSFLCQYPSFWITKQNRFHELLLFIFPVTFHISLTALAWNRYYLISLEYYLPIGFLCSKNARYFSSQNQSGIVCNIWSSQSSMPSNLYSIFPPANSQFSRIT